MQHYTMYIDIQDSLMSIILYARIFVLFILHTTLASTTYSTYNDVYIHSKNVGVTVTPN